MDIIIDKLTKKYGQQKAVDDISFQVKTGEILGFLGPNGAGKTTTMKAISTYIAPSAGTINVGDISTHENPEEIRKHIGYLPETNPLYGEMAVIDYLLFTAEIQGVPKTQIKSKVHEVIISCGLEAEKHKIIDELSKGYRQRVGLAQALIHDPEVLILDEPTSGLDPNQIIEIRELIRNIGKEKTVILSSHILAEVEATCDRILIINKGKIVADSTAKQLRKQSQGKEIIKTTIEGDTNKIFKALQEIESVELVDFIDKSSNTFEVQSKPDSSSGKAIFELCVKNKWILTELTPTEAKLEDVFRDLTMNK